MDLLGTADRQTMVVNLANANPVQLDVATVELSIFGTDELLNKGVQIQQLRVLLD